MRRILATTSWEVRPAGLSTMTRPLLAVVIFDFDGLAVRVRVTGILRAFARSSKQSVGLLDLVDQAFQPLGTLQQHVGDERDRRRVLQPGLLAHLRPDDAGGAVQRG